MRYASSPSPTILKPPPTILKPPPPTLPKGREFILAVFEDVWAILLPF